MITKNVAITFVAESNGINLSRNKFNDHDEDEHIALVETSTNASIICTHPADTWDI